ncbi:MAG: ribonuclease J [Clostridia bacterium]|nr:ribonuclease J [Clostridia bacterium]
MILSTPALYVNGEYNLEKENQSPLSQKNRRRSGNSRGNAPRAGAEKPAKRTSDKAAAPRGQKPRAQKPRSQKNRGEDKQRAADLKPAQPREKRAKAPKQPREGNVQAGKKAVKIVFLGGVGEIGKNMTAIECGDDIIIIDAGAIFPTEETPGFDLIVPDITYLIENRKKIRGLLLTHGHEDHIGGVPYLLKELKVPVIGTKLTLALVDNKLREHRINDAKEITVSPGQIVQLGCFKVRAVNVNHSIAGSLAFAIQTPQGVIFHSGDYKIDLTPVAGEPIDLKTISDFGASGVLLYMGESTNIERAGFTMSETVVGTTLDRLFGENLKRRLIVATFASNVHRLQQIIDLAVKYKRKVALSGRSMLNVVEAAEKIGEINVPDGAIVDVSKIKNMRDSEIVVVSTGSQGEPMSALSRMSNGENQFVTVGENDTVIISASPIPGNEKLVYRVINNLYKLGAEVVYESLQNIHVSGHACREEHKIMHHLLKPKFFIPVHGEYRHLKKHAQLAEELGMPSGRIIIPDIGNRVLLTTNGMKLGESVPSGSRLIDGEGIEEEKASTVIEDRRQLSEEGLFIVSVTVSGGVVLGEPAINSRGFVFDFHRDYDREIRSVINRAIDGYDLSLGTVDELKRTIKRSLANYLYKKTKQSPMIVPVVVEL